MSFTIRPTYITLLIALLLSHAVSSQVLNDECEFAFFLTASQNYCSGPTEYSNLGAQQDPVISNSCFLDYNNAVWFAFTAVLPAAVIRVSTDQFPQTELAVFSGGCNSLSLVGCTLSGTNNATVQLTVSDLIIGETYYLMVDSGGDLEGAFQICIDQFIPPPSPESDCDDAVILCDKSPFFVENIIGTGSNNNEVDETFCVPEERASAWYKWTCKDSGTLTFTLTPNNNEPNQETDDLDFIIFRLDNGLDDCTNKSVVRCMASGANLTNQVVDPLETWIDCNGPTGLLEGDNDLVETGGCQPGDNNFVRALNMTAGESYALLINNYSESGLGFSIEFGGTGTFLGPEADFDVLPIDGLVCDSEILFTDQSLEPTDEIVNYFWSFGAGASPTFANDEGPHSVFYDSFGEKVVALTIESSRGCAVTKIIPIEIESCCEEPSDLAVDITATDNICFGDEDGTLLAQGLNGSPEYTYSIDGMTYQPTPFFTDLPAGDYQITIRDRKGCEATGVETIDEPSEIIADAGQDTTVTLGFGTQLDGSYQPSADIYDVLWTPDDSIDCQTCLDPFVVPLGTTTYTLQVTDENGCSDTDEVTIRVQIEREIFWPNIFSPNRDGQNEFFNIFGGRGIDRIEHLYVFDRWGNRMYNGQNIPVNEYNIGWDGTFKDQPVNPGVYTWLAEVRYIDGAVLSYAGDVTVIR